MLLLTILIHSATSEEIVSRFDGRFYGRAPRGPLLEENSLGTHELKSTVRRSESKRKIPILSNEDQCSYNSDLWSVHPNTTITRAVMFHRSTGQSCKECLNTCSLQQISPWICRSVVYDFRWNICDLFAVTTSHPPFDLAQYDGRHYFEYFPAVPPSDTELQEFVKISNSHHYLKVACPPLPSPSDERLPTILQMESADMVIKKEKERKKKYKKNGKSKEKSKENVETTTASETVPSTTMEIMWTEETTMSTGVSGTVDDFWDMEDDVTGLPIITDSELNSIRTTTEEEKMTTEEETMTTETVMQTTDGFTTMKPKRLLFKGPHGKKIHGARTSDTNALTDIVDLSGENESSKDSTCGEDDVIAMVEFISTKRRRPYDGGMRKINVSATEDCAEECEKDNDCSSAIFSSTGCQLASTKAARGKTDLITSVGYTYIEKICLRKNVAKDRGTLFSAVRNFILTSYVEEIEDAKNMDDCIGLCLKARRKHGFHCLSAMWYASDKEQNCVLNREAGSRRSNHFVRADQSIQMVYIEIPDAVDVREAANESFRRKDDPLKKSKWTVWSSCEGRENDAMRYRYRKCSEEIDIRKCPRETAFCGPNPLRGPRVRQLGNNIDS